MSNSDEDLLVAITNFFTRPVRLPGAPDNIVVGEIWWEDRGDGYMYPWRMTAKKSGYPCGEPRRKETKNG